MEDIGVLTVDMPGVHKKSANSFENDVDLRAGEFISTANNYDVP